MNFLTFDDLRESGLFNSLMTLRRAIATQGFPTGFLVTPNRRLWKSLDVQNWIETRPTAARAERPGAGEGRKRAKAS